MGDQKRQLFVPGPPKFTKRVSFPSAVLLPVFASPFRGHWKSHVFLLTVPRGVASKASITRTRGRSDARTRVRTGAWMQKVQWKVQWRVARRARIERTFMGASKGGVSRLGTSQGQTVTVVQGATLKFDPFPPTHNSYDWNTLRIPPRRRPHDCRCGGRGAGVDAGGWVVQPVQARPG